MYNVLVIALTAYGSCAGPKRDEALRNAFQKVPSGEIREHDIEEFVKTMPWFARTSFDLYFGVHGGASYVVERCGDDGVITLRSALRKTETCISRCLYLAIIEALT